jgi:hypothetical protein
VFFSFLIDATAFKMVLVGCRDAPPIFQLL